MRKFFRYTSVILAFLSCGLFCVVIYFNVAMPEHFYVQEGKEFFLDNGTLIEKATFVNKSSGTSETVVLKLCGIIPIKETQINVVQQQAVSPGGTPFGIKLFTQGVMVIKTSEIQTANGKSTPAKDADISEGDMIISINSKEVFTNEEVASIVSKSDGKVLDVLISRDGNKINTKLTPALSSTDNKYKCGVWVRDSCAGIGTVTFFDSRTNLFAGLGHAICDNDTGKIMPLSSGEVCKVSINSVIKGVVGTPGQLSGCFTSNKANGKLLLNNEAGIFGTLTCKPSNYQDIPVAFKQDIKKGAAKIITTLDSNVPEEFDIEIEKINLNPKTLTKNMVIKVTDPRLLEKTGGIVQGMSGSPIIQNNRLVGAVTHVFVNTPDRGYGIFAENMQLFTKELEKRLVK
ncbi:MAG: SpoIVB peptidase [Oscillospiraceae bacterium]